MRRLLLISCFACAGCRSATDWLGFTVPDHTGKACMQAYQQMAYVENRSSTDQNVMFVYSDPQDGGVKKSFSVTIPAGGTLEKKLRDYEVVVHGDQGRDYPIDAVCYASPKTSTVDLNLGYSSFAQVKNCLVGEGSGLSYLIDLSATCPEFTTEQGAAL